MTLRAVCLGLFVVALACSSASAHPFHGDAADHGAAHGLTAGFTHPWLGLDHLLAMVAVGLLSVQLGGRALWVLPLAFLGAMVLGGALGVQRGELPLVEAGVATSLLVLGAALALGRRHTLSAATIVIAAFGLLHGHAHGTEMPSLTSPVLYATGFVAATALLHLAGITAGFSLAKSKRRQVALRFSGAAISAVGICLLAGLLV